MEGDIHKAVIEAVHKAMASLGLSALEVNLSKVSTIKEDFMS